ncbi:MAG TPA: hypothetical protein VJV78_34600 [Polyangiales bacterium]|nr:hypothetical protein [Polyangiales bacterium]
MKSAVLGALALAAFGCTDAGKVGRLSPKQPAAGGGTAAAGQSGNPACSQPPCAEAACTSGNLWCTVCATDRDCAYKLRERLCNPVTTFCVECRTDSDCPARRPYCDDGDCGECAEDDDCPGDMKCDDGACKAD